MKPTTYLQLVSPFYGVMLKHSANSTYEKLLCRRSLEKADHIVISKVSYPKMFLHPMDRPKLDNILGLGGPYYKHEHMEQIIVCAVKNDVTDLHKTLRDCIKGNPNHTTLTWYFTRAAIAYNRPEILTTIIETELKDNADGRPKVGPEGFRSLSKLCVILNRHACKEVFTTNGVAYEDNISVTYRISELLYLLEIFYDDFKDELVTTLKQIPNIQEKSGIYLDKNVVRIAKAPHVVKEILGLGADIEGNMFITILQRFNLCNNNVRETVKLLLGANPVLNQQQGVVELAIAQDELLYKTETFDSIGAHTTDFTGTYNSDTKEHGLFGHDDCGFALNFAAPFLLECGFPVAKGVLADAVFKNLHPAEIRFIQAYSDSPKPLHLICRDSLRNCFKGRKLCEFLEKSMYPQRLQDIILMKSLLQPH